MGIVEACRALEAGSVKAAAASAASRTASSGPPSRAGGSRSIHPVSMVMDKNLASPNSRESHALFVVMPGKARAARFALISLIAVALVSPRTINFANIGSKAAPISMPAARP